MSEIFDRLDERELRGSIILFLKEGYGREKDVTLKSLSSLTGMKETNRHFHAAIGYLVDSGYAIKVPRKKLYVDQDDVFDYRITPRGIQLVDRLADDVGIKL